MSLKAIIFSLMACTVIVSNSPERLEWEVDRPLQWSDFKGSPDYLLDYVATTNSGMSHRYTIDGSGVLDKSSSEVFAHFYTTFSWYKPEDTTAAILRHEQSHFDITEIHARKLRKRIHEFKFTENSKEEIKKLYQITEQERRDVQRLFDQETDHSRLKDQEVKWAERIRDSLEKYWVYTP